MRFNKPCLDCGQLSRGNRCETHQKIYDAKRNEREKEPYRIAKKRTLYNAAYRKAAKQVRDSATICHLCGEGARLNDPFQADHINPTDPYSPLAPAHRSCNASKGNKKPKNN